MTLDQAIITELLVCSGLPSGKIVWAMQGIPRPALPYLLVTARRVDDTSWWPEEVIKPNPAGHTGDPSATPPTIGTELLQTLKSHHLSEIQLEYFSSSTTGTQVAWELIHETVEKLSTLDSRTRLDAVDLVYVDHSPPQMVPSVVNGVWESRAICSTFWRYCGTVSSTTTFLGELTAAVSISPDISLSTGIDLEDV
jgi:hypothetical protein